MNDKLKAYSASDGDDKATVVFATNSATARREAASEMNTEWEGVDYCRRAPEFDAFAPGPVPPLVMIDAGWWFECSHCGRRVHDDIKQEAEDEGLDPDDFEPVALGQHVFCSRECLAVYLAHKRLHARAVENLAELVETKFPGCTIRRVHVYGEQLEASKPGHGTRCSADFTFAGAQYGATYIFGEGDVAHVSQVDVDAFCALYRSTKDLNDGRRDPC